ncbi:hypothetical protein A3K63_01845, partial [Candidatus Micrarchaeota archaeon RBG_16_49_10]
MITRKIFFLLVFGAISAYLILHAYNPRMTGFFGKASVDYVQSIDISLSENGSYGILLSDKPLPEGCYLGRFSLSGTIKATDGPGYFRVFLSGNGSSILVVNKSFEGLSESPISGFLVEGGDIGIANDSNEEGNFSEGVPLLEEPPLSNASENSTQGEISEPANSSENASALGESLNQTPDFVGIYNETPETTTEIPTTTTMEATSNETNQEATTEPPITTTPSLTVELLGECEETCDLSAFNLTQLSYSLDFEISPGLVAEVTEARYSWLCSPEEEKPEQIANVTQPEETSLVQGEAEVGKPVRWTMRVSSNSSRVVAEVPEKSSNLEVNGVYDGSLKPLGHDKIRELDEKKVGISSESDRPGKKTLLLEGETTDYEIEYETPAPEMDEIQIGPHRKTVTIYSDFGYENVLAYTTIADAKASAINLYHITENGKEAVNDMEYMDGNGNGLVDGLRWKVPHLSNQTYEISITVLNPYTYLRDGDTWTVAFNTSGVGNLTISSPNAGWAEFQQDNGDTFDEMSFLDLKCGDVSLKDRLKLISFDGDYNSYASLTDADSVDGEKLLIEDYSCDDTGYLSNYMIKAGYATLLFEFANENMTVTDHAYDPTNITDCSTLSENNTIYYLTQDITGSSSMSCMNLTAFNTTLDCQGHTIDGLATTSSVGINSTWNPALNNNNTIRDCYITDWYRGINLLRTNYNTLYNLTLHNNSYAGVFIRGTNNTVYNTTATNSTLTAGILIDISYNTTIYNVTLKYNYDGLENWGSYDDLFYNINTSDNMGRGIKEQNCNRAVIFNVTAVNNAAQGIWINDANFTTAYNIISSNNANGLSVKASYNCTFYNMTLKSNYWDGIEFYSESHNNTAYNLTVASNTIRGIYVSNSSSNLIYNSLFNNTLNAYFATYIYNNSWNATQQAGARIYSNGNQMGGNYWTNSTGNGYSDTCTDANKDGFCDSAYILDPGSTGNNTDYLPLSDEASASVSVLFTPDTNTTAYPSSATIQCNITTGDSGATLTLYRNGTSASSGSGNRSLSENPGAGYWNYTCTYDASESYTASSNNDNWLTVERASPMNTMLAANNMTLTVGGSNSQFSSAWAGDSGINASLGDVGSATAPTVFNKDGTWYMIAGKDASEEEWGFIGYNWTGSAWQGDSRINASLVNVGSFSAPTVFNKDGTWYLIIGNLEGNFIGFNWTGTTWQQDSQINASLDDVGQDSVPTVFNKDGTWYLISGEVNGGFYGFNWTGTAWQGDNKINTSLGGVGYRSTPSVFNKDGTWYLISGEINSGFYGFNWTGTAWQGDSGINASLGDIGANTVPAVFNKDGTWYLISGEVNGGFYGFNRTETATANLGNSVLGSETNEGDG